jgi:uncharacterized protein YejL (UPF0352 family)
MSYNSKYTGAEVEQLLRKIGDVYSKEEIDERLGDVNIILESIIDDDINAELEQIISGNVLTI